MGEEFSLVPLLLPVSIYHFDSGDGGKEENNDKGKDKEGVKELK